MLIKLTEEVAPDETVAVPVGTLLNSPAPTHARYLLARPLPEDCELPSVHWTESDLDDFDLGHLRPGTRIVGLTSEEIGTSLARNGHIVEVYTRAEQCADAQLAREREREHKRAKSEREYALKVERDVFDAALADLTQGLVETGYSSYWTIDSLVDLVVISELRQTHVAFGRTHVVTVYRAPEGIVVRRAGTGHYGVTCWATPETADRMRVEWAQRHEIDVEQARRGLASPYVGADQRRMYLLAIPPGQQLKALGEALRGVVVQIDSWGQAPLDEDAHALLLAWMREEKR